MKDKIPFSTLMKALCNLSNYNSGREKASKYLGKEALRILIKVSIPNYLRYSILKGKLLLYVKALSAMGARH